MLDFPDGYVKAEYSLLVSDLTGIANPKRLGTFASDGAANRRVIYAAAVAALRLTANAVADCPAAASLRQ